MASETPLNLTAIRRRDDERPSSYVSWWGVMAVEDRRLLLGRWTAWPKPSLPPSRQTTD